MVRDRAHGTVSGAINGAEGEACPKRQMTIRSTKARRFRSARTDCKVGALESEIAKVFGLPRGSTKSFGRDCPQGAICFNIRSMPGGRKLLSLILARIKFLNTS